MTLAPTFARLARDPYFVLAAALGFGLGAATVYAPNFVMSWLDFWPFDEHPWIAAMAVIMLALFLLLLIMRASSRGVTASGLIISVTIVSTHFMAVKAGPLSPYLVAVAVMFWICSMRHFSSPGEPWQPTTLFILASLLYVCVLFSCLGHTIFEVGDGAFSFLPKLLALVLLTDMIRTRKMARMTVDVFLYSSIFVAILGLAQVALYFWKGVVFSLSDPNYMFAQTPWGPVLRASAFASSANQFAPPLAAACVMAAYLCAMSKNWRTRTGMGLAFIVLVSAVGLSIVRGSWIAIVAGLVLIPLIAHPRFFLHWLGLFVLFATVVLVSGFGTEIAGMIVSVNEAGTSERMDLAAKGVQVILTHPSGSGVNNFGPFSPTFERYPVHNAILQIGSELGLGGLLIFVLIMVWTVVRLVKALRACHGSPDRSWVAATLAGYLTMLIAAQTEPMGFSQTVWIFIALADSVASVVITGRVSVKDA